MQKKKIQVNRELLEQIEYQKEVFPLSFYRESFDEYLKGEFSHHWHNEFEMGIILKGALVYSLYGNGNQCMCQRLNAGDGLFINSKVLHSAKQIVPGTVIFDFIVPPDFFNIHLEGEAYRKLVLPFLHSSSPGLFLWESAPQDAEILQNIAALSRLHPSDFCYELQCVENIYRIWRLLYTRLVDDNFFYAAHQSQYNQDRAKEMLLFIQNHYAEYLTVEKIAQAAHIGKSECFRCFHSAIGKTPMEYLCDFRLSKAAYLLANSDKKLSDICFSCGFNSASYFGKLFKQKCGLSPSAYRKKRTIRK